MCRYMHTGMFPSSPPYSESHSRDLRCLQYPYLPVSKVMPGMPLSYISQFPDSGSLLLSHMQHLIKRVPALPGPLGA